MWTLLNWYLLPAAVLRGIPYRNNSIVFLEDIGEYDDALLCITNQTACCRPPHSGVIGNWFFPNGTRVPSSGGQQDIYRTRGQMVVLLHRKRGGVEGIYRCEIPDTFGFIQTLYIRVYSVSTGKWCTCVHFLFCQSGSSLKGCWIPSKPVPSNFASKTMTNLSIKSLWLHKKASCTLKGGARHQLINHE